MLSELPVNTNLNQNIINSFIRLGPMTFHDFAKAASEYKLRGPPANDGRVVFKSKKDTRGNMWFGQFDKKTDKKCGVIRTISASGDFLFD